MESIVKKVIRIDEEAVSIREKINDIKKKNEKKLKEDMRNMEKEIIEKARIEGKALHEKIAKEGEEGIREIEEREIFICKEIERIYREEKNDMLIKLFSQIFINKY